MAINFRASLRKNLPEATAFATGKMPSFVYGFRNFKDIPVFCFHSAGYPLFEEQLLNLKRNGYRTLSADELYERLTDRSYRNDGREIVLTFDDGMASVWTVAFPLLQKYEYKIISFILPGLTEASPYAGLTIADVSDAEKFNLANRDFGDHPLCNWKEIELMHESGLVDIQSHGMHHELICVSPKIVDFIHPGYDAYHYGNIHVPIFVDAISDRSRAKVVGHPVFDSAPRLSGRPRYFDPPTLRSACEDFISRRGGVRFFATPGWRARLGKFAQEQQGGSQPDAGSYESASAVDAAIKAELRDSKRAIEARLPAKEVRHFCFPWFHASSRSAELALDSGYLSIYLGAVPGFSQRPNFDYPVSVTRLQEEYLFRLPGNDSISMLRVLSMKNSRRKSGANRE